MALYGELALEEAMDLLYDRLRDELNNQKLRSLYSAYLIREIYTKVNYYSGSS
jgi:uncharacterized protein Yka (UPF0111/DUF47 family)